VLAIFLFRVPSLRKLKKRKESSKDRKKRERQVEKALTVQEKTEERLYKLADKSLYKKSGKNLWD